MRGSQGAAGPVELFRQVLQDVVKWSDTGKLGNVEAVLCRGHLTTAEA